MNSDIIDNTKFIYFVYSSHSYIHSSYQCDCPKRNQCFRFGGTVIYDIPSVDQLNTICKFTIENAIEIIENEYNPNRILDAEREILIETNSGEIIWSSREYYSQGFYKRKYWLNQKELICEKCKRGYLDALPSDIWNMIKKYIIYS